MQKSLTMSVLAAQRPSRSLFWGASARSSRAQSASELRCLVVLTAGMAMLPCAAELQLCSHGERRGIMDICDGLLFCGVVFRSRQAILRLSENPLQASPKACSDTHRHSRSSSGNILNHLFMDPAQTLPVLATAPMLHVRSACSVLCCRELPGICPDGPAFSMLSAFEGALEGGVGQPCRKRLQDLEHFCGFCPELGSLHHGRRAGD